MVLLISRVSRSFGELQGTKFSCSIHLGVDSAGLVKRREASIWVQQVLRLLVYKFKLVT